MSNATRGFTATEILVASAIMFIVVMGVAGIDAARTRIGEDIRRRSWTEL